MRIRLLGTSAGGGFPQWNCACAVCQAGRADPARARPRTQSGAAVSADGRRWFLLNASPDVTRQIEAFAPLLPRDGPRGTGVEGVLLTNADLDHTLGLLLMREGGRLAVHATAAVRRALTDGLALDAVLGCYGGIEWREPPTELAPLRDGSGRPVGLSYAAFPGPGKPPRYREGRAPPSDGDCVGYRLVDDRTGGRLVFLPGMAALDGAVLAQLAGADALLLDGTFWSEDEMQAHGAGAVPARRMGHLPVGGPGGSLARVGRLAARYKVYTHVNNTNPMLLEDSPERRAVEAAGVEVGRDGMEFEV